MNVNDLYLYVLVRTDLDTMGRGRACAQSGHAANQFVFDQYIERMKQTDPTSENIALMVGQWMNTTGRGFGTQIVKDIGNLESLQMKIHECREAGYISDLVIDPDYFVPDGISGHIVKDVVTCGYVFGDKTALWPLLGGIPLLLNDPISRPTKGTDE